MYVPVFYECAWRGVARALGNARSIFRVRFPWSIPDQSGVPARGLSLYWVVYVCAQRIESSHLNLSQNVPVHPRETRGHEARQVVHVVIEAQEEAKMQRKVVAKMPRNVAARHPYVGALTDQFASEALPLPPIVHGLVCVESWSRFHCL